MENKFEAFSELGRILEKELDFDFSVNEKYISDFAQFERELKKPFESGEKRFFYRGERKNDITRPLVPTLLRDKELLLKDRELVVNINSSFLRRFYAEKGQLLNVFEQVFSKVSEYRLYELCAFCQHYINVSPFIDFTKSLYVALSFALKGKTKTDDDFVIYTAEIPNSDYYTNDIVVAECWLNDYSVNVYHSPEEMRLRHIAFNPAAVKLARQALEQSIHDSSPKAKLIDIPTNDLVKYQQGVFLMLTDFSMFHKSYLTKNLREDFCITKYVINKELCAKLTAMVASEAPWYAYDCILDIKTAMQKAIDANGKYLI